MKYVYFDKSDKDKDLICNALDSICVPYKTRCNRRYGFFCEDEQWEITIDVLPDKMGFVLNHVNDRLKLEKIFHSACADRHIDKFKKPEENNMAGGILDEVEKHIKRKLHGHNSIKEMLDAISKDIDSQEVKDKAEKLCQSMKHTNLPSLEDILGIPPYKKSIWQKIKDFFKWQARKNKPIIPPPPTLSLKDLLAAGLSGMGGSGIGVTEKDSQLVKDLEQVKGKVCEYSKLPDTVKSMIGTQVPIEILNKSLVRINVKNKGYGMDISVEIVHK